MFGVGATRLARTIVYVTQLPANVCAGEVSEVWIVGSVYQCIMGTATPGVKVSNTGLKTTYIRRTLITITILIRKLS